MITGVLLSAGKSERMGETKVLLKVKGRTIIEILLDEYINSDLDEIVLVLGRDAQTLKDLVERLFKSDKLNIIINENYELGMFSSIQKGAKLASGDSILLGLADNMLITRSIINTIISHYTGTEILIPTSNGRKGHPVIFPKTLVGEIIDTDPKGATLKDIFSKHSDIISLLPIERNEILVDMDTKDDYKDVLKLYEHF